MVQVLHGDASVDLRLPDDLAEDASGLVYVALRDDGVRVAEAWYLDDSVHAAIHGALIRARDTVEPLERARIDTVEAVVAGRHQSVALGQEDTIENLQRGIVGLTIEADTDRMFRFGPTQMIAENTSFTRVVERLLEDGRMDVEQLRTAESELFDARQFLVDLSAETITRLTRGNEVVKATDVTAASTEELAGGMAAWLANQLGRDGRMVYEYWPSRGEESQSNNMIRQWMASRALLRIADEREDDALDRRVQDNIAYNLLLSYREENGLGLIADPDGDVKLGAVALAALALSQNPDRAAFAEQEAALRRMVDHLWQPDGSFETFYLPAGRIDNQNFYPGEVLLLWAVTLENELDPTLLERFMLSFEHYRAWHREQPNPAFVPWHTMSYVKVWGITHDPALRDFVFEMNDWLLDMQQWDDAPAPDVAGRFYDPDRPDYGPPHASSDGVYLEGLAAAHRLAVEVGDDSRAEAYRVAIARGIRNLMQLQFSDEVDMYYVSKRDRVSGGLRTTVYDNAIRVDNVQHGLLAVMDVLDAFAPADYRIEEP